uniref:Uncharacterized protein n=1 Tax=Apiospora arundinis TaxID=335852 RepID=A0A220IDC4_9PEZI|nr:hypothetical protein [Apiospora arundinis]ASH96108.1 hypothetical protein [Apiospora arundinis]
MEPMIGILSYRIVSYTLIFSFFFMPLAKKIIILFLCELNLFFHFYTPIYFNFACPDISDITDITLSIPLFRRK